MPGTEDGWSAGEDRAVSKYLLDNRAAEAGERLRAFSAIFDPWTFEHMRRLGLGPGWRCWEVGAGGTSVVRWIAHEVGATGSVLATDIDVSWAGDAATSNVEVRVHDVERDEPPGETFDLIHARLVLVHLRDRESALHSLFRSLKPGAWLLIEDADPALQPLSCLETGGPDEHLANRIRTGFRQLLSARGADLEYGRKLPRLLRQIGLTGVQADAYFPVALGACIPLEIATVKLIRAELVSNRIATDDEIERHLARVAGGHADIAQPPLISAWGQRP